MPNIKDQKKLEEFRKVIEEAKTQAQIRQSMSLVAKTLSGAIVSELEPVLREIGDTIKGYLSDVKKIKLEAPKLPQINVSSPVIPKAEVEVKVPKIEVPEIKTDKLEKIIVRAISKIKIPTPNVEVKEREMPKEMKVKGIDRLIKLLEKEKPKELGNISQERPLNVVLTDPKGMEYKAVSSSVITGGNNAPERKPHGLVIYNKTIAVANTEYSQVLPDNTKKFKIYGMNATMVQPIGGVVKYTTKEGESGTKFIPIPPMGWDGEDNVDLVGQTIYFQATAIGVVVLKIWV